MSVDYEEWSTAIDKVVDQAMNIAEILDPPIDAMLLAERLKHWVLIDNALEARGCRKQVGCDSYILIRHDERNERMYFVAAHELGEALAANVCRDTGEVDYDCIVPRLREDLANRIASHLLCPNPWFSDDARRCNYNLLRLK